MMLEGHEHTTGAELMGIIRTLEEFHYPKHVQSFIIEFLYGVELGEDEERMFIPRWPHRRGHYNSESSSTATSEGYTPTSDRSSNAAGGGHARTPHINETQFRPPRPPGEMSVEASDDVERTITLEDGYAGDQEAGGLANHDRQGGLDLDLFSGGLANHGRQGVLDLDFALELGGPDSQDSSQLGLVHH